MLVSEYHGTMKVVFSNCVTSILNFVHLYSFEVAFWTNYQCQVFTTVYKTPNWPFPGGFLLYEVDTFLPFDVILTSSSTTPSLFITVTKLSWALFQLAPASSSSQLTMNLISSVLDHPSHLSERCRAQTLLFSLPSSSEDILLSCYLKGADHHERSWIYPLLGF